MASIIIIPRIALADVPISICVVKLKPYQFITVRSELKDESGNLHESQVYYNADDRGVVDFCKQPSTGGSYTGIEPMGLFWSMQPSPKNKRKYARLMKQDVCSPYEIEISVFDSMSSNSEPILKSVVERWYKDETVQRIPVREGRLRATLFVPVGEGPFPAVIDLLGSTGGLIEYKAALLSTKKFVTLSVAYFNFDDLPKTSSSFDIEYFEEAKDYLMKHPKVKKQGIGIVGISLGGVIALSMATCLTDISCVIAINTTVFSQCALSYRGRQWNSAAVDLSRVVFHNDINIIRDWYIVPEIGDSSVIEIDKSSSTFLFLISEDDQLFNSNVNADFALKILTRSANSKYKFLRLPGAGHVLDPPYSPHFGVTYSKFYELYTCVGGNTRDHAAAQEKAWTTMISFLRENLLNDSKL